MRSRKLGLEARAYGAIARAVALKFRCLDRVDEVHAAALRGAEFARLSYRAGTGASLSSWMYTKAKWAAVDEARGKYRKGRVRHPDPVSLDEEIGDDGMTAMDIIGDPSHESRILQRMYCEHLLSCLGAREGWLCRSYYIEGWSESYLARCLGLSESRVSQQISRALKRMRAFAEEGEGSAVSFAVRKCSICRQPGHKSTTCPQRPAGDGGSSVTVVSRFSRGSGLQSLVGDPIRAAANALEDEIAALDEKRASLRAALDALRKLLNSGPKSAAVSVDRHQGAPPSIPIGSIPPDKDASK